MSIDLTPERWLRISTLFDQLVELDPQQQDTVLNEVARDDADVSRELRAMLAVGVEADRIIDVAAGEINDAINDLAIDSSRDQVFPSLAGPWRLTREIARGGMGVVFLGERADAQFEQRVAVKLIKRGLDTDEIVARFLRERQILARMQHPNIAGLVDGGATEDGRPYFAMEYVDGVPISSYCDTRSLLVEARLRLFITACRAVSFAHRNLIVHRDLKPTNILITGEGAVKLLDFGIAKLLSVGDESLTQTEARVLTPAYAAPEQIRGESATTATDVYGLGTVLYELLSGRRAFDVSLSSEAALRAVLETDPPLPSTAAERRDAGVSRQLRGDLDAVVMKALRKEPDRRYGSVEALARDLERWLDGVPVQARKVTAGYRARKFVSRHRVGVATAAIVALAVIAGVAGTLWQARAAALQARKAEEITRFLASIFQVADPSESRGEQITAREILDRGAVRIERELAGQPDVQTALMGTVGEIYYSLGLFDRAAPLLERALNQSRALYGSDSAEVADASLRIGRLQFERGEHAESIQSLDESLAVRRRLDGPRSPRLAEILHALGATYQALGKLEEAERVLRQSHEIVAAAFGNEHLRTAESLSLLADIVHERHQDDAEAEAMARRALDVRRRLAGNDHPETFDSVGLLATILRERGNYTDAETLYREELSQRRRILAPDHPSVAITLNGLAQLYEQTGRLTESLATAREALELRRLILGEAHPYFAVSVNNHAVTAYRLGMYREAEPAFREAFTLWQRELGAEHAFTTTALNNLGMTVRELGRLDEAETLVRQVMATRQKVFGEKSQEVAQSLRNLGLILTDRRAFAEAASALERAVQLARAVYSPEHPRMSEVLVALGRLRLAQGRGAEAQPLVREALALRVKQTGERSPQTAEAKMYLGAATCRNDVAEGRVLLKAAEDAYVAQFGADDWRAADTRRHLAFCLTSHGRVEEGRALATASLSILRTKLGEHHYLTEAAQRALAGQPGAASR
jgi:tetratricopeptide (TPR) repeat protein/tRNA A-37 threonylcarbamoyl transferase component Bud32